MKGAHSTEHPHSLGSSRLTMMWVVGSPEERAHPCPGRHTCAAGTPCCPGRAAARRPGRGVRCRGGVAQRGSRSVGGRRSPQRPPRRQAPREDAPCARPPLQEREACRVPEQAIQQSTGRWLGVCRREAASPRWGEVWALRIGETATGSPFGSCAAVPRSGAGVVYSPARRSGWASTGLVAHRRFFFALSFLGRIIAASICRGNCIL